MKRIGATNWPHHAVCVLSNMHAPVVGNDVIPSAEHAAQSWYPQWLGLSCATSGHSSGPRLHTTSGHAFKKNSNGFSEPMPGKWRSPPSGRSTFDFSSKNCSGVFKCEKPPYATTGANHLTIPTFYVKTHYVHEWLNRPFSVHIILVFPVVTL